MTTPVTPADRNVQPVAGPDDPAIAASRATTGDPTAASEQAPGRPRTGRQAIPAQPGQDPIDEVHVAPLIWTTSVCALAAVLGHVLLGLNYKYDWLPWQPIVGASLSLVAVTSFGGFYLASRRARIAITASFLLTFLVLLTQVITISEIADVTGDQEGLVSDFRIVIQTIIAFYFGTEAIVAASKVLGVARTGGDASAVRRADRDLV